MSTDNKNLLIAERYAESLIAFGTDGQLTYDVISQNLQNVLTILNKSKDLFEALTNPLVSHVDKCNIIDAVFEKDVDVLIKNFLKLLVEKNRFDLIYDVSVVYHSILDDLDELARIEVTSAVELNDSEKSRIQDKLSEKLNKKIVVNYKIDESIIAGLVVKMGDDIIDTSLAQKLEDLKMAITK